MDWVLAVALIGYGSWIAAMTALFIWLWARR